LSYGKSKIESQNKHRVTSTLKDITGCLFT